MTVDGQSALPGAVLGQLLDVKEATTREPGSETTMVVFVTLR